jgi:hypothetical protein
MLTAAPHYSARMAPIIRSARRRRAAASDIVGAKPILKTAGAWDIGDGIACLEFHSKMNSLIRIRWAAEAGAGSRRQENEGAGDP